MYRRAQRPQSRQDFARGGTSPFASRPFAQVQRRVVTSSVGTTIQRAILPHETRDMRKLHGSQVRIWLVQKFEDELAQRGGKDQLEKNMQVSWIPRHVLDEIATVFREKPFDLRPHLEQVDVIEKLRLMINDHLDQIDVATERIPRPTMYGVPIGNELTFTNDALRDAVDGKDKKQRAKDMPAPFIAARSRWQE